ncbi:MAG TPA: GatB/YqeY domain-containing protein [Chloroflexota bacterium]|nr:GatB/YqeY domain-containing protein [Chloroflexota bacterium]
MTLSERIQTDMTAAMKSKDELRLSTLRLVRSAMQYARVQKRAELTDDDVIGVLSKEAKQRRESAEEFRKAGRPELAAKEEAEAAVVVEYLPEQMSEADIRALVGEAVAATGASTAKEMGKVMGWLSPRTKGRADGRQVSEMVREALGSG